MAFRFQGDFAELARWRKLLAAAGATKTFKDLNAVLAEETVDLIAEGFAKERDPYGNKWAAKELPNGKAILVGAARLRNSWKRKALSAEEFTVSPSVEYAVYHQHGTGIHGPKKRPIKPKHAKALSWKVGKKRYFAQSVKGVRPRRMIPEKKLPATWRKAFVSAALEFLEDMFGG